MTQVVGDMTSGETILGQLDCKPHEVPLACSIF